MATSSELHEILDMIKNIMTGGVVSLRSAAKATQIMDNVFVDQTLMNDETLPDVLGLLTEMYAGYVLTALNLIGFIKDARVKALLGKFNYGQEELLDSAELITAQIGLEASKSGKPKPAPKNNGTGGKVAPKNQVLSNKLDKIVADLSATGSPAAGKIISLKLNVDNQNGKPVVLELLLNVQLRPTFLEPLGLDFITRKYIGDSVRRRWTQVRTGEISFFKDFLLSLDRAKAIKEAIRKDRSGALLKMMRRDVKHAVAVGEMLHRLVSGKSGTVGYTGTVILLSQDQADLLEKKYSFKWDNILSRERFMIRGSFFMVGIMDSSVSVLTLYINGIGTPSHIPYKTVFKAGGNNNINLRDIMQMMANNRAPAF